MILGPNELTTFRLEQNLKLLFDTLASNPTIGLARQGNLVMVNRLLLRVSMLVGIERCEGLARFAMPDHRNQVPR